MSAKKSPRRMVTNPYKDKNIGRRTGKDVKAGKVIRMTAGGFENFDDYWSESDADVTRVGSFVKPGTPAVTAAPTQASSSEKQTTVSKPQQAAHSSISTSDTQSAVLAHMQAGNVPVKGALNPFKNKNIGWRTGKDIKAGKNIGVLHGGFENFDDYWSESDADSMASFSSSTISRRMTTATSPALLTQKSSVYVSIMGGVTGSITCQENDKLTPQPCLFGTRKRLSYSYAAGGPSPEVGRKEKIAKKEQEAAQDPPPSSSDRQDQRNTSPVEAAATPNAPATPFLSRIEVGGSAPKSGISFWRLSHHPSSSRAKRSRKQLSIGASYEILPDDITTPPLCTTHLPVIQGSSGEASSSSSFPSMSATPVHYFHVTSPATKQHCSLSDWDTDKIIPPEDRSADGLRRSKRTRVKRLEWYKNERIIYDRRRSGPVVMAVKPSRERLYLEQEKLKRKKRQEGYLERKKQQQLRGRPIHRLSTQLPLLKDVHLTPRLEVTVLHPHTRKAVHMACFNPASCATAMGPRGEVPTHNDPYTIALLTQQRLFTTGVLTLAPAAEKPLQRAISTAVLYSVTYGKVLVTINTASRIMEMGDHFFVPGGTVYMLRNLRYEEAVLTFSNLMMEMEEQPSMQADEQPDKDKSDGQDMS